MQDNTPTPLMDYKSVMERDGMVVQLPSGTSMKPMLIPKQDTVIIKKVHRKPKVNDVVLYLTDDDQYILHRIVKVTENGYVIRGDNNFYNEYNVKDKHILGILEGFYKKDKYVDCEKSLKYKLYVCFNRRTYYIRYLYRKTLNLLGRIKAKSFK